MQNNLFDKMICQYTILEEMLNIYFAFLKYEFTRKKYYDLFGKILYKKLKKILERTYEFY